MVSQAMVTPLVLAMGGIFERRGFDRRERIRAHIGVDVALRAVIATAAADLADCSSQISEASFSSLASSTKVLGFSAMVTSVARRLGRHALVSSRSASM